MGRMATERQMRSMLHSSSVSAVGSTTVRNGLMGPSGGTTDACADADADVISLAQADARELAAKPFWCCRKVGATRWPW